MPFCWYLFRYFEYNVLCLSDRSIRFPWMNAIFTCVRTSNIFPSDIKKVASLPDSNEPTCSSTPRISAEESVMDRKASSKGSP